MPNPFFRMMPSRRTYGGSWHCISITFEEAFSGWKRTIDRVNRATLKVTSIGPTNPMRCCRVNIQDEQDSLVFYVRVKYPPQLPHEQQRALDIVLCKTDFEIGKFQVEVVGREETDFDFFGLDETSHGQ
jgi:hypothetical protein